MTWHCAATTLSDYAAGTTETPQAWSVEAHLVGCPRCREVVGRLLAVEDVEMLARKRLTITPPQPRPQRVFWSATLDGILGPWWAWGAIVATAVVAVAVVGRLPVPLQPRSTGVTWLVVLSPLVPIAMVAAVYALADRDETTRATPRDGLELVRVRTAAALVLAVPAVTVGRWSAGALGLTWLLPGLGLCVGALALGTWIGVERAALALTSAWALIVALVMMPGSPFLTGGARLADPGGPGLWWWGLATLAGLAVLLQRLDRFDTPARLR